jgi:NtrC-family two-component system response regulator AlgB
MRERLGDLLRITGHYLEFFSAQCKKPVKGFTPRAAEAMQRYSWPGNLRELRNLVERAVILVTGDQIDLADLPEKMRDSVATSPNGQLIRVGGRFSLEELEGEHIRQLLAKTDTMEEASKILGIDPATLYRKRKKTSAQPE